MESKDRSWVEIDLSAFRHNLRALKKHCDPHQQFMQIVKADAYGHGAIEISRVAVDEGASLLGVANVEEGKLLRIQGCNSPILILSPSLQSECEEIVSYQLAASVSDIYFAKALSAAAASHNVSVKVHLKIDSGMHRSGVALEEFPALWEAVSALPHLEVEGIFSHYAKSENDIQFSKQQLDSFHSVIAPYSDKVKYIHIANSSALVNSLSEGDNLVRLGILSYGVYTDVSQADRIQLEPVMTFKSHIAQIKDIKAGEGLGYNLSWTAPHNTRYGVIPVGYADGYDFMLSNRGKALIQGKLCPVIGRISMDMTCVLLDGIPDVACGTTVSLMGVGDPALRVESLAASYEGSSYELLCQVGRRARRYYLEEGNLSHLAPIARRDFVSSDFTDSKLSQIIQSAISQRLRDEEIGELISREILRVFFFNKDQDIHYRKGFIHHISLQDSDNEHYWRAHTRLGFRKILQNDYFIVACATSDAALRKYFMRKDVEYRWLMDDSFELDEGAFELSEVYVNDIRLEVRVKRQNNCLQLYCHHPLLESLVGTEVSFRIDTASYYPKASHQLSVFINELTHGVKVSLDYPPSISSMEVVTVFSGQNRYPTVTREEGKITVHTRDEEWVFPQSGVVFAY